MVESVVVFDVDGTICFDGQTVHPDVVEALHDLRRRAQVVFASARPIRDLLPVLPKAFHECTLIGGNGAFTRAAGLLNVVGIAEADRRALDSLIDRYELKVLIDGSWDYCFTGNKTHRIYQQLDVDRLARNVSRSQIHAYSKVVLFTTDVTVMDHLRQLRLAATVHTDDGIIDISPMGVTKRDALNRVGIADHTYIAFGNDVNDVRMLESALVSYRVGNNEELMFADQHIDPSAVADAIVRLLR